MSELNVNDRICTRCGLCAKVCPTGSIGLPAGQTPRYVGEGASRCISCGHCEAVCPAGALTLYSRHFAPADYGTVDAEMDPEQLAAYLHMRRSVRNYRDVPVERSTIDRLMDLVRYAPSSSNSQSVRWLIIYNTEELRRLTGLAVDWMRSVADSDAPITAYFDFEEMIRAWDRGEDPVCRHAPHLVVAYAHKDAIAARTDAIIALSHLDVIAPSLGLGTCWGGFFQMAATQWLPLQAALDLPMDHVSIYAMMLGYPQFPCQRPPRRNPVTVTWRY